MCEEAYWAGVIDCYAKEITGKKIILQSHASWQMVKRLADYLEGTYKKRHKSSKRSGYTEWVITIGSPNRYSLLMKTSQMTELRETY